MNDEEEDVSVGWRREQIAVLAESIFVKLTTPGPTFTAIEIEEAFAKAELFFAEADRRESKNFEVIPKKRKYWRSDPVDTFEEATKHPKNPKWALFEDGDGIEHYRIAAPGLDIKWLRRTECEE